MKRFLVIFMVLGLVSGSVATAEAKKTIKPIRIERTVEGNYGPYPAPITGCNGVLDSFACLFVPTRASESFFTARVTDLHGRPVFVQVKIRSSQQEVTRFCGEMKEPIRITPGTELVFYVGLPVWGVQTNCAENSVKTTGTISVTLSNLP